MPRIHPEVLTLFAHRTRTGRTFPTYAPNEAFERTGQLPVIVRWSSPPDRAKRESLAERGVVFDRHVPIASGGWLVRVTEQGLHTLREDPEVTRVSVDMHRRALRPLEKSLEETRANVAKRAAIVKNGERLDGKGIVIADIDGPIFLHHPAFFRADGGTFAWIDVDGDGALTPGKDGVDLDGNGTIEPAEVLHDLRSTALERYTGTIIEEHSSFAPETDYLYLDTNGNGKRDYGKGFDEKTPAYGEPLFVFDDVNHDQKTQTSERVIQLKTHKVRALASRDQTFRRGKSGTSSLNAYPADRDERDKDFLGHSTGVAGILVGGQPGLSKWVGFAPEADLIVADGSNERGPVSEVQWAIDEKADVILTEYAPFVGVTLDGSSEEETILDAANARGIVTVSPAGNLAIGRKHRTMMLASGANKVDLSTNMDGALALMALHWRGAERSISLKLTLPNGSSFDLPASAPEGVLAPDGSNLYVMAQTTPRGTHERFVGLVAKGSRTLPRGKYQLTASVDAGPPLEVDLYASDDVSSWAGGFSFDQNTPERTLCSPSTSDETISVAAYVLHDERPYNPAGAVGALAKYSSRGPRLDGEPGIEIAAPDNPLSTAPPSDKADVTWEPFGGTSGAGPHVVGAVALIKEAFPKENPAEIKTRLFDNVRPEADGEELIGKGKLDIAAALGATIASGDAPKVNVELVGPATVGTEAVLRTSAEDEDQASLLARWDLDYDGKFDTQWLPLGEQVLPLGDPEVGAKIAVKVEVRDNQGNINGATMTIEVAAPAPASTAADSPVTAADEGCLCHATGARAASSARAPLGLALVFGAALLLRARRRSVCRPRMP